MERMGRVLLPGTRVRLFKVVVPIKVLVLAMKLLKVTLPWGTKVRRAVGRRGDFQP